MARAGGESSEHFVAVACGLLVSFFFVLSTVVQLLRHVCFCAVCVCVSTLDWSFVFARAEIISK